MTGSFLREPPVSPQVRALYDDDLKEDGDVANVCVCGRTSRIP